MWYLIGLIWVALIGGVIWSYSRKRQQKAVKSASEYDVLITELKTKAHAKPAAAAPVAPVTPAAAPTVAPLPEPTREVEVVEELITPSETKSEPEVSKKQRLLSAPEALMYYVFRTGLPDHTIFVKISLA